MHKVLLFAFWTVIQIPGTNAVPGLVWFKEPEGAGGYKGQEGTNCLA